MKVYRAIRDIIFTGPVYKVIKAGTRFFEIKDSLSSIKSYQPEDESYPITGVEDNPNQYERLEDDNEHDVAYYVYKVYTQYQVDQIIKNLPQ